MPKNVELFACLDISYHPMVAWEVAIGRLRSIDDQGEERFGCSLWEYGNLCRYVRNGLIPQFVNELKLEALRKEQFNKCVSRLHGVYLFETREAAEVALQRWGWGDKKSFISQINFSANRVSRHDTEWITTYLGSPSNDQAWMKAYWSGESYGKDPTTEVLASGIGIVVSNELRELAYRQILRKFPRSSKIMALGATAFYCGYEDVAQVRPALIRRRDKIHGGYYLDMRAFKDDSDIDFRACVDRCQADGVKFPYNPICDADNDIHLPDFGNVDFDFSNAEAVELLKAVQS